MSVRMRTPHPTFQVTRSADELRRDYPIGFMSSRKEAAPMRVATARCSARARPLRTDLSWWGLAAS
jgi:hypothetical protein